MAWYWWVLIVILVIVLLLWLMVGSMIYSLASNLPLLGEWLVAETKGAVSEAGALWSEATGKHAISTTLNDGKVSVVLDGSVGNDELVMVVFTDANNRKEELSMSYGQFKRMIERGWAFTKPTMMPREFRADLYDGKLLWGYMAKAGTTGEVLDTTVGYLKFTPTDGSGEMNEQNVPYSEFVQYRTRGWMLDRPAPDMGANIEDQLAASLVSGADIEAETVASTEGFSPY
jgi:hypothetical protein